jgi:hypothetical protein
LVLFEDDLIAGDDDDDRELMPIAAGNGDRSQPALLLSLNDWKGSRVLARRQGIDAYMSACIRSVVNNSDDIGVQFDDDDSPQQEQLVFFRNIIANRSIDIIADQAPSPDNVQLGTVVCARRTADECVYQRAEVVGLSMQPVSFQVIHIIRMLLLH